MKYFTAQAVINDGFNFAFFYQPDMNNPWIFAVTTDLYLGFIVTSILIYLVEENKKISPEIDFNIPPLYDRNKIMSILPHIAKDKL